MILHINYKIHLQWVKINNRSILIKESHGKTLPILIIKPQPKNIPPRIQKPPMGTDLFEPNINKKASDVKENVRLGKYFLLDMLRYFIYVIQYAIFNQLCSSPNLIFRIIQLYR